MTRLIDQVLLAASRATVYAKTVTLFRRKRIGRGGIGNRLPGCIGPRAVYGIRIGKYFQYLRFTQDGLASKVSSIPAEHGNTT